MIKIYEKAHKSSTNLHGIKEIVNNPLLYSPCIICISKQEEDPEFGFGIIREAIRSARLRTRVDDAARYDLDNFPAKFLSTIHSEEKPGTDYIEELSERLFLSLYCQDNKKLSLSEAKRRARNVTIMSYSNGVETYLEAEKYITKKMLETGYQENEIKEILGQQFIIAINTDTNIKDFLSTCIELRDVSDCKLQEKASFKTALSEKNIKQAFGKYNENTGVYYYNGTGKHYIKSYFEKENLAGVILSTIVATSISNSIINHEKLELFEGINLMSFYKPIKEVLDLYDKGITPTKIMEDLDKKINYYSAKILTIDECRRLAEVDSLCDIVIAKNIEIAKLRKINTK